MCAPWSGVGRLWCTQSALQGWPCLSCVAAFCCAGTVVCLCESVNQCGQRLAVNSVWLTQSFPCNLSSVPHLTIPPPAFLPSSLSLSIPRYPSAPCRSCRVEVLGGAQAAPLCCSNKHEPTPLRCPKHTSSPCNKRCVLT